MFILYNNQSVCNQHQLKKILDKLNYHFAERDVIDASVPVSRTPNPIRQENKEEEDDKVMKDQFKRREKKSNTRW